MTFLFYKMSIPIEFQVINKIVLEDKIIKSGYHQTYHKSGDNIIIETGWPIEFNFDENLNYIQIGGAHLEFDITVRKDDNNDFCYHLRLVRLD